MMAKVVVRDNIIIPGRIPTDTDLKALDCYYESFVFEIDSAMTLEEKIEYALNMVKPYTKHMYCDSVQLISI